MVLAICENINRLSTIMIIKNVIIIICFILSIILIISNTLKYKKNIIQIKEILLKRIIYSLLIILIPLIIIFSSKLVSEELYNCIINSNSNYILEIQINTFDSYFKKVQESYSIKDYNSALESANNINKKYERNLYLNKLKNIKRYVDLKSDIDKFNNSKEEFKELYYKVEEIKDSKIKEKFLIFLADKNKDNNDNNDESMILIIFENTDATTLGSESIIVKYQDSIEKVESPIRIGYTFNGWYTQKIDGIKVIDSNGSLISNINDYSNSNNQWIKKESTTLYAQWNVNTYSISYELDGGINNKNNPLNGNYNSIVELKNPTKTGYSFNGWEISGKNSNINGSKLTIGDENVTLTAKWKINTYTITYNLNGGTNDSNNPTKATYSSVITLNSPTKTGWVFVGWTVSGTNSKLDGNKLTIGNGNVTLTAKWTEIKYTITYNLNGGINNLNNPSSASYGNVITLVNPTKIGYTFDKWVLNTTNAKLDGNKLTMANENVTLTAKWKINTYTITYNLNGGTNDSNNPTKATYSSVITLNSPTKAGWVFVGWTVSGTNSKLDGNKLTIGNGDVTLTAQWTEIKYTITYNLNGGTNNSSNPKSAKKGQTVTLYTPIKKGNIFTGWFVEGNEAQVNNDKLTMGNENVVLTATWISIVSGSYVKSFTGSKDWIDYNEVIPNNITNKMPLIVFLHGDYEVNNMYALQYYSKFVSGTKDIYGNDFPYIILQPNTRVSDWTADNISTTVKELIDKVCKDYDCDTNHIIITGASRGAIGTWDMVNKYKNYFSAAVPVSCRGTIDPINFKNVPLRAFVGSSDDDYGYYYFNMKANVDGINAIGGKASLEILPNESHSTTFIKVYSNKEVIEWMLNQ